MKKTLAVLCAAWLCLAGTPLCVWAANPEPGANPDSGAELNARAERTYKTTVTVKGTAAADLQAELDKLPDDAGDVLVLVENTLTATTRNVVFSVPEDKGISSLTLSHDGDNTVYIYTYGGTDTMDLFANGVPLIIDEGVCFGVPPTSYSSLDVKIFGGSKDADITGNPEITVNRGGIVNGYIYGGGYNGGVQGNVSVTVYGGCAGIYGGSYVRPQQNQSGNIAADVTGSVTIRTFNPGDLAPVGYFSNYQGIPGSIYGGGQIVSYYDLPDGCTLSAQVLGGVTLDINCQMGSGELQGGGAIYCTSDGSGVTLNADVRGGVRITAGALLQQCEAERQKARYLLTIAGGGRINATGKVAGISAQIYDGVTIQAVEDTAAASGEGGCGNIIGGGFIYSGTADYNATVNGNINLTTSRKSPIFVSRSGDRSMGVVGGGYASDGVANVIGDVNIHICKAPGQSADYRNVKNLVGGGVASQNGIAQVLGNVEIVIDDDIAFEGGWIQTVWDNEKLGITGGGWVIGYGGNADVTGTVRVTVGKGAIFGEAGNNEFRIIGGGKIDRTYEKPQADGRPAPSAKTGEIFVTLNGTENMLDELFCTSLEGRAPAASATITLRDSYVGFMYDKDITNQIDGSQSVTIRFLGDSRLDYANLGGWDYPKNYVVEIGDGTTPTEAEIGAYYINTSYGNQPDFSRMDVRIFGNASLTRAADGTMFYNAHDLTIDEGGIFAIRGDEWFNGSLHGGGTLEILTAGKRLRMVDKGAVFDGDIKVRVTAPVLNQVVATTITGGSIGHFIYDGEGFSIKKREDGYGNYDWYLGALPVPPEVASPAAASPVYTGSPQALVTGGAVTGGALLYSTDGAVWSETVPTAVDAGTYTVYYKVRGDADHTDTEAQSITVTIARAAQPAPAAPKLESKTTSSVTLKAVSPVVSGGAVKYSRDGGVTWQTDPVFTDLSAGIAYRFVVQYTGTKNYLASPISAALQVTTDRSSSSGHHGGGVQEKTEEQFTTAPAIAGGSWANCKKDRSCPIWPFEDADAAAWYHNGVHYCLEEGLMQGYGHSTFGPNDALTRGMLAQIFYNKEHQPSFSWKNPFVDVASGIWYDSAVTWAAGKDIVKGYGNGTFGPEDPITREQLAAMLWRYAGSPASVASLDGFKDADQTAAWAKDAMCWAVERGIIVGKSGGILDPAGLATRAEVATMLFRYCTGVEAAQNK